MSLIVVETFSEQPLTSEILNDAHERIYPCLTARDAVWRYSMLSSDRHHLICTYDAPDAESVREAYRNGGMSSSRAWSGFLIQPEDARPASDVSRLTVMQGTYPPISDEAFHETKEKTLQCYGESGIEWVRSYLSLDRTRLICELSAPDLQSIREVQHRLNIPFEQVWSAEVMNP